MEIRRMAKPHPLNRRLRKQLWYVAAGTVAIVLAKEFGPSLIRYLRLERM